MITKKTFALALFFPLFIVNAAERIADFKPLNAKSKLDLLTKLKDFFEIFNFI